MSIVRVGRLGSGGRNCYSGRVLEGESLFLAVFGKKALSAKRLKGIKKGGLKSQFWLNYPFLFSEEATRMCTHSQFRRFLELAPQSFIDFVPEKWSTPITPNGEKLLFRSIVKALEDGVERRNIGKAPITGVDFMTAKLMADLLDKELYFGSVRRNLERNWIMYLVQDRGVDNDNVSIGLGFISRRRVTNYEI